MCRALSTTKHDIAETGASSAVLVGVGGYDREPDFPNLPAARENVRGLARILTGQQWWGLPISNCRQIADPNSDSEVALAIAEAAEQAEDTLLVYYAGHGLVSRNGELVLAMSGTSAKWPQFTGLRYSWVREAILSSRVKRRIAIIDCCFSGRAIAAMGSLDSLVAGGLDIAGTYVLTATPANTPAMAPVGDQYTAFTASLLRVLEHGTLNGQPVLTLNDIYEHIRKDMIRAGTPQPLQMGTNGVGDLPFVRNASNAALASTGVGTVSPVGSPEVSSQPGLGQASRGWQVLLSLNIANFDAMSALDQVDAQLLLIDALDTSARQSGKDPGSWVRRPHRCGEIIIFPNSDGGIASLRTILRSLRHALRSVNVERPVRKRLGVQASVHLDEAVTLEPAPAFLGEAMTDLVVVVSDTVRRHSVFGEIDASEFELVRDGSDTRPACYWHIDGER